MTAYVVVEVTITDPQGYAAYLAAGQREILALYGGRLLVVDGSPEILEGQWPHTRTVLIEFPSKDKARQWYESPEYRAVAGLRHEAAHANLVIVEALPGIDPGQSG